MFSVGQGLENRVSFKQKGLGGIVEGKAKDQWVYNILSSLAFATEEYDLNSQAGTCVVVVVVVF